METVSTSALAFDAAGQPLWRDLTDLEGPERRVSLGPVLLGGHANPGDACTLRVCRLVCAAKFLWAGRNIARLRCGLGRGDKSIR